MNACFCASAVTGILLWLLPSTVGSKAATSHLSDWSVPINLGAPVNTAFIEAAPAVSKDALSLYLMSDRPGTIGGFDIWVAERASVDEPWGAPVNLWMINTAGSEDAPALSRDGHWLFFASDRPGGVGGIDIWVSWRPHTYDNFGWGVPVNVGAGVNSPFTDGGASYFENDETGTALLFFASDRPGGPGSTDIYVSELMSDGTFSPAMLVAELSSAAQDARPTIRHDGREVFFYSGPFRLEDLFVSTRDSVFAAWTTPTNLGTVVNGAGRDIQPYLSSDGKLLYFASGSRPDGFGRSDIYVTMREKVTARE